MSVADFAPTRCSLAGIRPPEWRQGHAFLGTVIAPAQPCVCGFRGRMDERYDLVRRVTDDRYVYLRNSFAVARSARFNLSSVEALAASHP